MAYFTVSLNALCEKFQVRSDSYIYSSERRRIAPQFPQLRWRGLHKYTVFIDTRGAVYTIFRCHATAVAVVERGEVYKHKSPCMHGYAG